jgi:hypothetical protein
MTEDGGRLSTLLPDTNFVGFHTVITLQATTVCTLRYRTNI